jgi:hypothetical protein
MINRSAFLGNLFTSVALLAGALAVRAQVTITSADMFNQVGQYYRAYANNATNTVTVTTLLGSTGGPQAWDLSTTDPSSGLLDMIYRFDYLAATNTPNGADFVAAGAQLAEQKKDEAGVVATSWLYFTQDPTKGRLDYGFYDPTFAPSQPESLFTGTLQDFPAAIHYGDTWQGTTVFNSIYTDTALGLGDFPDQLTYTSTDKVDAYGVITLPNLGFLDCLRIHEVVEYDIAIDLGLGDGYQNAGTQYVLNYYWLAPGHGIAAQVTSTSPTDGSKPADDLPGGAAAVLRMFQTNHSSTNAPPPPTGIQGFKITLGKTGALLQWTTLSSVSSYRVDYTTKLASPMNWLPIQTNTANYFIDAAPAGTNAPVRYYRVVGLN